MCKKVSLNYPKARSATARNQDWGRRNFTKRKNVEYTRAIDSRNGALREKRRENSRADAILRHRDLVAAEMFGCVAACITSHVYECLANPCYPCTCVPTHAPSGTRPRRYGARLLSLPDSLAARRPTGYAERFPPSLPHRYVFLFPFSCVFSPQFLRLPALFAPFPTMSSLRRPKVSSKNNKVLSSQTPQPLFSAPLKNSASNWICYSRAIINTIYIITPYKDVVIDLWRYYSGSRHVISNSVHSINLSTSH